MKDVAKQLVDLDRDGLKTYISDNKLDVKVLKSMSDDDLRETILLAVSDSTAKTPQPSKLKKGEVRFISTFPKQWIGHIQFQNGEYITPDKDEIDMLKNNSKYGSSIRISK